MNDYDKALEEYAGEFPAWGSCVTETTCYELADFYDSTRGLGDGVHATSEAIGFSAYVLGRLADDEGLPTND